MKRCAESVIAIIGLIYYRLKNPVDVPVFVIGTGTDAYFPKDSLNSTAIFYHTEASVLKNMCHDLMLDPDWEKATGAILEFMHRPEELKNHPDSYIRRLKDLTKKSGGKGQYESIRLGLRKHIFLILNLRIRNRNEDIINWNHPA